jgi:hypothetical protein
METEQHIAAKQVSTWKSKGRSQKVPGIQCKGKYNLPDAVGHSKGHVKGKVYSISAYI